MREDRTALDHTLLAALTESTRLILSFSPHPMYRNRRSDTKWYVDVSLFTSRSHLTGLDETGHPGAVEGDLACW
jgi:hypothetical protein